MQYTKNEDNTFWILKSILSILPLKVKFTLANVIILSILASILESLSEAQIIEVNIPTGVPLVYELDNKLIIIDKKYLIDEETLKRKKEIVENQGKIK